MEIAPGKIVDVVDGGLMVFVPYGDLEKIIKRRYDEVQVGLPDGRRISPEQRRKAYALMREIGEFYGYEQSEIKDVMKHDFVANHLKQLQRELFSLSDCDVTTAKEFISYLIDFILRNDIPTHVPLASLADDIDRYMYSCLMRRKCCICGQKADIHHWTRIGMGANRKTVIHEGMPLEPLCRVHHTECHTMAQEEFDERYHIKPIKATKEICKMLGLKCEPD